MQCGLAAFDARQRDVRGAGGSAFSQAGDIDLLVADYEKHQPQILIPLYRGFRGNPVLLDRSVFPEIAGAERRHRLPRDLRRSFENIRKMEVEDPGVFWMRTGRRIWRR